MSAAVVGKVVTLTGTFTGRQRTEAERPAPVPIASLLHAPPAPAAVEGGNFSLKVESVGPCSKLEARALLLCTRLGADGKTKKALGETLLVDLEEPLERARVVITTRFDLADYGHRGQSFAEIVVGPATTRGRPRAVRRRRGRSAPVHHQRRGCPGLHDRCGAIARSRAAGRRYALQHDRAAASSRRGVVIGRAAGSVRGQWPGHVMHLHILAVGAPPTRPRSQPDGKDPHIDHVFVRGATVGTAQVQGARGLSDHNLVITTVEQQG